MQGRRRCVRRVGLLWSGATGVVFAGVCIAGGCAAVGEMEWPMRNETVSSKAAFGTALLLVDYINAFDFEGGDALLRHARRAVRKVVALKRRLRALKVPVIYANDNFGRWQSDFPSVSAYVREETAGAEIASRLVQDPEDYFVLKPKHSAFYLTPLELLLRNLGVKHLILCGLQTDICILLTAHDAHMREYVLTVPRDCSASERLDNHRSALKHMEHCLHARVINSESVNARWLKSVQSAGRPSGKSKTG